MQKKKSASLKQYSTHDNTMIFGQGDRGKTPYNSWGKPVRKLLLISGKKYFYSERNIQKNQQVNFYNLSRFLCLTTASENVQTAKTEQQ